MKNILAALALVALGSASAHAQNAFDGVYAGGTGSYGTTKSQDIKDKAFSGGAFAGYGTTFGQVYLGAEGNFDFGGFELERDDLSAEKKSAYGATGRVGYVVSPRLMAYGLAGYERARIEVSEAGEEDKIDVGGLKFGAGAETLIRGNLAARTEVTYTAWDKGDDFKAKELKSTIGLAVRF